MTACICPDHGPSDPRCPVHGNVLLGVPPSVPPPPPDDDDTDGAS